MKKGLVVLLVIAVLLFSSCKEEQKCSDSDEYAKTPDKTTVRGTCTDRYGEHTDYCADQYHLWEFSCSNNICYKERVICEFCSGNSCMPGKCANGKCKPITSTQTTTPPVSSPSGTLYFFWATWCTYCHQMEPNVDKFAANYPTVTLRKVNYDENRQLADSFGVVGLPTVVYVDGSCTKKQQGYMSYDQLVAFVFNAQCEASGNEYCQDTDGGINYYEKGYISKGVYDYCLDNTLVEFYCAELHVASQKLNGSHPPYSNITYNCEFGCSDGACIEEESTNLTEIAYEMGGCCLNPYKAVCRNVPFAIECCPENDSYAYGLLGPSDQIDCLNNWFFFYWNWTIACVAMPLGYPESEQCEIGCCCLLDNNTAIQFTRAECEQTEGGVFVPYLEIESCSSSACESYLNFTPINKTHYCYDSDRGENLAVYGYCEDEYGVFYDDCQDDYIVEFFCSDNGFCVSSLLGCNGTCINGTCVSCLKEGEVGDYTKECCPGLTPIEREGYYGFICSNCGNGICESQFGEDDWSCPQDCNISINTSEMV